MFGIGDNHQHNNDDPAMLDNVKQLVDDQAAAAADDSSQAASDVTATDSPAQDTASSDSTDDSSSPNMPAHAEPAQGFSSGPLPDTNTESEPASETTASPEEEKKEESDLDEPKPAEPATAPTATISTHTTPTIEPADPKNLAQLKEEALGHLEPLVEHLGGTPEEVFKTTMMMIQANDNHKLIEKALEAARKIEDDKVRAKAMLDIINEINYFSQDPKSD